MNMWYHICHCHLIIEGRFAVKDDEMREKGNPREDGESGFLDELIKKSGVADMED